MLLIIICITLFPGLILLAMHLRRCYSKPQLSNKLESKASLQEELILMAELADASYHKSRRGERISVDGLELPFKMKLMDLELLDTVESDSIWLWKVSANRSTIPCTHLLVYRGSHAISEWFSDIHLVRAVAGSDTTAFRIMIENKYRSTCSLLEKHQIVKADIVIVGHSLGATIAEAIVSVNNSRQGTARFRGYTFDSPGLPESFLRNYPLGSRQLVTVNSTLNPVNALTKPVANQFYSCGAGCAVTPKQLLINSFPLTPIVCLPLRLLLQSLNNHPLSAILQYLRDGDFRAESIENWPNFSGFVVGLVACTAWQRPRTRPVTLTINIPHNAPIIQPVQVAAPLPQNPESGDFSFPADGNPEQRQPYVLNNFTDLNLRAGDIILCFVGYTSVGKSSIIKALLDIPIEDDRIKVRATSNTTIYPTIVYWCDYEKGRRLFLVDLPGFGATGVVNGQLTTWTTSNIKELVRKIRDFVGAAIYVTDSCYRDDMGETYKSLKNSLHAGSQVLIVHNRKDASTEEDFIAVESQIASNIGVPDKDVIPCKVFRQPGVPINGVELIEPLREALPHFCRDNAGQIMQVTRTSWKDNFVREKDANGYLYTSAAAAVASAAVWAPGLAGWGALAGPVLVSTPVAAIALVPAAVVVGSAFGFSWVKSKYWYDKAEQECPY